MNFRTRYLQSLPLTRAGVKTFHLASAVAAARNVTAPDTRSVSDRFCIVSVSGVAATRHSHRPRSAAPLEQCKGTGRNRSTKHDAHPGSPPRGSKRPGQYRQPYRQPSSKVFGPVFCRRKNPGPPANLADPHPRLGESGAGVGGDPLTMQQIPGPRSGTLSLHAQSLHRSPQPPPNVFGRRSHRGKTEP